MKVVIVGNGGREHAIAWCLLQDERVQVTCVPGNGGTAALPRCRNLELTQDDFEGIARFCTVNNMGLVVIGPENTPVYSDLDQKIDLFSKAENFIFMSSAKNEFLMNHKSLKTVIMIPLKTYIEKAGSFTNHAGIVQGFKKVTTIVSEALTAAEAVTVLTVQNLQIQILDEKQLFIAENKRPDAVTLDNRKKNEFVFQRGKM